jgi:hypothetical protein
MEAGTNKIIWDPKGELSEGWGTQQFAKMSDFILHFTVLTNQLTNFMVQTLS